MYKDADVQSTIDDALKLYAECTVILNLQYQSK
jgi:hypothetical protein